MVDLAILVLRVCLATVFLAHGAQLLFGCCGGPGVAGFAQSLSGLGFKPALFWAVIAAGTSFFGGVCVLLGFGTRIASAFIAIFMLVAMVSVHLSKGFFLQSGGFEYNFVLICLCVALMMLGGGKFSITKKM